MDELIQKASALIRQGTYLFRKQPSTQFGVLGGYLLIWLVFTGSLTETLLVAVAMSLGWLVGRHQPGRAD